MKTYVHSNWRDDMEGKCICSWEKIVELRRGILNSGYFRIEDRVMTKFEVDCPFSIKK